MVLARFALSSSVALGITFFLFLGMQYMVAMGDAGVEEKKSVRVTDFVRLKRDAVVKEKQRALPTKPKALDQPDAPKMNMNAPSGSGGLDTGALAIKAPSPSADLKMKAMPKLGAAPVSDRSETPLVRLKPQYPMRAAQDGIEGWVKMRFDINPQGQVKNVTVLAAQPRGVFERAATKAMRRWRYRPKVENGVASWRKGVVVKMPFKLRD